MANPNDSEQLENQEQQPIINPEIQGKSEEELLRLFSDKFFEYFQTNKANFFGKSLEDIFRAFISQDDETLNDIISEIERSTGEKIDFSTIKDLTINTGRTLKKQLSLDLMKQFKRKSVIKGIYKTLENKINNLSTSGDNIVDFSDILNTNLENEENIEKVNLEIRKKIAELPDGIKKEIYKLNISNKEILDTLLDNDIINDNEKLYLEGDITAVTDTNVKDKLNNIIQTMFSMNMADSFGQIITASRQLGVKLEKMKNIGPLWNLVSKELKKIDDSFIESKFSELENQGKIAESYLEDIKKCDKKFKGDNNKTERLKCKNSIKKLVVQAYLDNQENLIDYLKSENRNLGDIIEKLFNKQNLTNSEKKYIWDNLSSEYIENAVETMKAAYNFTDIEETQYKNLLEQILDPSVNQVNIGGININIDKEILSIEDVDNIKDLFETIPYLKLTISGDDVDNFRNILPQYFSDVEINGIKKPISIFSKVKVTEQNGTTNEGYIIKNPDGDIEIYANSDDALARNNTIKTISKDDIQDIDELDKKLILVNGDIPKLSVGLIASLPNRNTEESIVKLTNELENNNITTENPENNLTPEEKEKNLKEFEEQWKVLEGDINVGFTVGSVMKIRGKALNIPGLLSNWYYLEITNIDKDSGTYTVKINGGIIDFEDNAKGKEFTLPISSEHLRGLRTMFYSNVFRFKKINSAEDFANYYKEIDFKSNLQGFQDGINKWKSEADNIKAENGKLFLEKNGKKEKIKYIGKDKNPSPNPAEAAKDAKYRSDLYDVWEVIYKGDTIILKDPGSSFKKEVDWNTFLAIIGQNELAPWTEKEYNNIKNQYKSEKDASKLNPFSWLRLFSWNQIKMGGKMWKDALLHHFQEDDRMQAAKVFNAIAKGMSATTLGGWFFGDIAMEAEGEVESVKWGIIQNAKSRLERAGEQRGKNHGKVAGEIIVKEIFEPVMEGGWFTSSKKLSERKKLKAAGYLIYALENGPGPYFRALNKYAGKGVWIRALLGDAAWKNWKKSIKALEVEIKKNPDNNELRNKLVLSEMFFIKEYDTRGLYTANFSPTIEGLALKASGDMSKVDNVYNGEADKGSFDLIYDGFKAYVLNNRPPNALGALKALVERADSYSTYIKLYKAILQLILSGFLYHNWETAYREEFDKICRTYGIPIGLFAGSYNGINKILHILDYIGKKKGIELGAEDETISKYIYGKDASKVNVFELKGKKSNANVFSKLEKLFTEHGEDIVQALDYSDTTLLESQHDEDISNKEKEYVGEYFNKVNSTSSGEDWEVNTKLFKTAYAPYYNEGVFNIHSGAFSELALNIDEGEFENKVARGIWEGIQNKLQNNIKQNMDYDHIYEFTLRRFMSWFDRGYKSKEALFKLIKGLKTGNNADLKEAIVENIKEVYGGPHKVIPPEMEEALNSFVEAFEKRPENINNVIQTVFADNSRAKEFITDMYLNNIELVGKKNKNTAKQYEEGYEDEEDYLQAA